MIMVSALLLSLLCNPGAPFMGLLQLQSCVTISREEMMDSLLFIDDGTALLKVTFPLLCNPSSAVWCSKLCLHVVRSSSSVDKE